MIFVGNNHYRLFLPINISDVGVLFLHQTIIVQFNFPRRSFKTKTTRYITKFRRKLRELLSCNLYAMKTG